MSGPGLLIRADANKQIGFGHVMRCLALAQQWTRITSGQVTFACHQPAPEIASRIDIEGFQLASIASQPGCEDDASQMIHLAKLMDASIIVMDGYDFDSDYQRRTKAAQQDRLCSTLVIDDYSHLDCYHADFLLNQNAGVDVASYDCTKNDSDLQYLIGPEYALLRQEFLRLSPTDRSASDMNRILITLGGSDPGGITQKVIDGLTLLSHDSLRISLLSSAPGLRITDPRIDLVQFVDNVAELYRSSDFAVCGGGSTNWELSYFGIPRLVIVLAENQSGIAESLEQRGCCRSLGWHQELQPRTVANALKELIEQDQRSMRNENRKLIDGMGARRVVEKLIEV